MFLQKFMKAIAFSWMLVAATAPTYAKSTRSSSVTIANNSGGTIAAFAMDAADYRISGTLVKFKGRCDSACTLFLSLPSRQTCVSSGASFRFHAPYGVSARAQRSARAYLMSKYPGWVRAWIGRNNGLTRNLITMDYSYASKFMRNCDVVASR